MKIYANMDENEVKSAVQEICDHYKFALQKFLFSHTRYGSYYFIKCRSTVGYGVTAIIDTDYNQVSIKVNADIQSSDGTDILAKQIDDARSLTDEIADIIGIRW